MMKQIAIVAALMASASAFSPSSRFEVNRQTVLAAEWKPPAGQWVEKDYTAELQKLEKEAEERLETKIAEMMTNIEKTGSK